MSEAAPQNRSDISEERQWELALASLQRSNESTAYLRALMFIMACGLISLALPMVGPSLPRTVLFAHLGALVLSAIAICIIAYSWHIQRVKARERFNYLRERKYDAYLQYDKAVETISFKRDSWIDFVAFVVILLAVVLEAAARYQAIAAEKPPIPLPGIHV